MHLLPSDAQDEIINGVTRFLDARLPFDRLFGGRFDRAPDFEDFWRACADAGWFGLSLPEEAGGAGFSVVEEMLVQHALGRSLAPLSLLATPLAAQLAWVAGETAVAADLAAGGRCGFAVRLCDDLLVIEGDSCDFALSVKGERIDLRRLGPAARREPSGCLDPTLTAVRVATGGRGVETIATSYDRRMLSQLRVLVAAHLSALADRARDLSVEYANTRQQFGRPIGSFQAIKHRCADMAVRCEAAFTQTCAAAVALRDDLEDLELHVAASLTVAQEAAIENARHTAQIHGGIGMTEQHVAHLLIKRTHVLESLGADCGMRGTLLAP